jgi:hypothetical protein
VVSSTLRHPGLLSSVAEVRLVYTTQPGGGPITNTYTVQPNGNQAIPYPGNGMTGTQVKVSPQCDPNNAVLWEFAQGNSVRSTFCH